MRLPIFPLLFLQRLWERFLLLYFLPDTSETHPPLTNPCSMGKNRRNRQFLCCLLCPSWLQTHNFPVSTFVSGWHMLSCLKVRTPWAACRHHFSPNSIKFPILRGLFTLIQIWNFINFVSLYSSTV